MTTLPGRHGYHYGYDPYDEDEDEDEDDGIDEKRYANLQPRERRIARKIVHKERVQRATQWCISLVGTMTVILTVVAVVLATLGYFIMATVATLLSCAFGMYLLSIALDRHSPRSP